MSVLTILSIGIGGFFGAISRYLVSNGISLCLGPEFPFGTLTVNAIGSLILGFLSRFLLDHLILDDVVRIGVLVGFLGAFTTFSTFSYESVMLLQEGEYIKAGLNVVVNCLVCLSLCFIGLQLAKSI